MAGLLGLNNVGFLSELALQSKVRCDSLADQLHHFVTASVLVLFATLTGLVEYAGEPLNCWSSNDFGKKQYQDHVNQYCWKHSLFHYPNVSDRSVMPYDLTPAGAAADFSVHGRAEELGMIHFYRWVTVIFLFQAFCFKLPNLVWTEVNTYLGSNIVKLVQRLRGQEFPESEEDQEKALKQSADFLENWLRVNKAEHEDRKDGKEIKNKKRKLFGHYRATGDWLTLSTWYLLTKALFLLNVLAQFLVVSVFLGHNFWLFGWDRLQVRRNDEYGRYFNSLTREETFPFVALCHFQWYDSSYGRDPNGAHGEWVQCLIGLNMFLEKLFLIEWCWFLLMILVSSFSLVHWSVKVGDAGICRNHMHSQGMVGRYLHLSYANNKNKNKQSEPNPKEIRGFVKHLRNDGVFVLRILAHNVNDVTVAELVWLLWERCPKKDKLGGDENKRVQAKTDTNSRSTSGAVEMQTFPHDGSTSVEVTDENDRFIDA